MTEPIKRALELRKKLVEKKSEKILVVDFSNTLQGKDTSRVIDLMPIIGTSFYPFRAKINVKEIDPLAAKVYGKGFFDISKATPEEIEVMVRKAEFDFPLWYKHDSGFKMEKIQYYNLPFILQVGGCNFHDGSETGGCHYCFVDDKSNNGERGPGKVLLGIDETIDSMLQAREKIRKTYAEAGCDMDLLVLRTSGGEPTIVLDWILNLWRRVRERGLDFIVGQIDSNLSTAMLVEDFEQRGIFEKHTLEKLAEYPIKVLTAIKGVDEKNIQENVQSTATIEDQKHSLIKFVKAGFDIFPQMYNPNPETLTKYLEKMDGIIENFSRRIHIGPLKLYGPNSYRLEMEAKNQGIDKNSLIESHKNQWDYNYKKGCEVIDAYLRKTYGIGYKEETRSDVKLSLKKL